jgi:hypothetical protein
MPCDEELTYFKILYEHRGISHVRSKRTCHDQDYVLSWKGLELIEY